MKIMLEEIERKRVDHQHANSEHELREREHADALSKQSPRDGKAIA